ncbi:hypothetical protein B0H15DRAFT_425231 [Mycena belliarum]|uniref:RING-type domain-containing protein n=1 Tax=Mycena belliarum TaxID=1033014 RepID=A0AAD6XLX2_9AGAR|nr:hypothetical protein B0H15DRAFT_425231 [Mycena belliae]
MSGERRTAQSARKSTGGAAPRRLLDEPVEDTPPPQLLPLPDIPAQAPGVIRCGLCPMPLRSNPDPSQPIHHFLALCQHQFHYLCYINYISTTPPNKRTCCPQCNQPILTDDRYWVFVTTNSGSECYTDITKDVEDRLSVMRLARQQILIDVLAYHRNLSLATVLVSGPNAVDVNYPTPTGGFTPLHLFAKANDVTGIDFLLSHGADKELRDDAGLTPVECARSSGAWDALQRLT